MIIAPDSSALAYRVGTHAAFLQSMIARLSGLYLDIPRDRQLFLNLFLVKQEFMHPRAVNRNRRLRRDSDRCLRTAPR